MSDLTEGYVCAACDAKPDHKCYLRNGRWLCGPCYDMERIEEFEKDVASLRASVERLTRERGELVEMLGEMYDAWENGCPITEGGEPDGAHLGTALDLSEEQEQRILALLKKNGQTYPTPTHAELTSRAESAEATIARLAMVVKRAHKYRNECQAGVGCDCAVGQGLDTAFSSLTAEDRRRAGIEG